MITITYADGNARYNHAYELAEAIRHKLSSQQQTVVLVKDRSVADATLQPKLVFAIGGDGTIMRAMKQFRAPVFGINAGTIGFLAGAELSEWQSAVERVLAGDCVIEPRSALSLTVTKADGTILPTIEPIANEVIIEHKRYPTQQLQIRVAGETLWQSLFARGVLVATATGSNAQNFAAGGELLFPTSTDAVITPINPQLAGYRSFSLPQIASGESIEIEVQPGKFAQDELQLLVDGVSYSTVFAGDQLTITAASEPLLLATFGLPQYFRALRKKGIVAGRE